MECSKRELVIYIASFVAIIASIANILTGGAGSGTGLYISVFVIVMFVIVIIATIKKV